MIDGTILPQEWERFRMHADFVQYLTSPLFGYSSTGKSRCIASSTLSYLGRLACGTPLLPNLRALYWNLASPQCTALFPLISRSIDQLTVMVCRDKIPINEDERQEWRAFLRSTLSLIVSVSTDITDLYLSWWREDHSIAEPVSQLQSLRCFTLTTEADGNLLRVLAALPSLQDLELHRIMIDEHDTFTQADAGFLRLQHLSLIEHPNTTRFYQLFGAPGLQDLRPSFRHADDYRDVLACCVAWTRHFPLLEKLVLLVRLGQDADQSPQPYSSILEPLFQLRFLKSIDLDVSPGRLSPHDADIEAASHSWPQLVRFWVAVQHSNTLPSRTEDTDPCIGPSSLVLLASRCPQLRALMLPRVKINLQDIDALAEFPVLDHRLKTLSLRNMCSDDCALAALLIDRLFPHLLCTLYPPGTAQSESIWGRVQHHVKICQAARQQQTQRTGPSAQAATAA